MSNGMELTILTREREKFWAHVSKWINLRFLIKAQNFFICRRAVSFSRRRL